MGNKGDKASYDGGLATEGLVSKLKVIGNISTRKMFGGHGIFHQGKMFGIVDSNGTVHLRTNDSSCIKYEKNGGHKHGKMPYHSIPETVLNDMEMLIDWANESIKISKN